MLGQKLVFDPAIEKAHRRALRAFRAQDDAQQPQAGLPLRARARCCPTRTARRPGLWVEQDGKVLCMLPGPAERAAADVHRAGGAAAGGARAAPRPRGLRADPHRRASASRCSRPGSSRSSTATATALSVAFCAHAGQVDCRLSSPERRAQPCRSSRRSPPSAPGCSGEDFVCYGHDSLAKVCADLLRAQEKTTGGRRDRDRRPARQRVHRRVRRLEVFRRRLRLLLQRRQDAAPRRARVPAPAARRRERRGARSRWRPAPRRSSAPTTRWRSPALPAPAAAPTRTRSARSSSALHAPHGVWSRKLSYPGPRTTVKQRAVNAALDWLRRELVRARQGARSRRRNALGRHAVG